MTYEGLYHWGREELLSAEVPEAQLDARLLLEAVCGTGRNDLLVHGGRAVESEEQAAYERLVAKRKERIPLQYLTGVQEFMGLEFLVDGHVLIPRQDTEILVEEVLKNLYDGMRILDLCTGSGCILISLLHYSNDCQGVGADISEEALAVARRNARRLLGPQACVEGGLGDALSMHGEEVGTEAALAMDDGGADTRDALSMHDEEVGTGAALAMDDGGAETRDALSMHDEEVGAGAALARHDGESGLGAALTRRSEEVDTGAALTLYDGKEVSAGAEKRCGKISFIQGDLFEEIEGKFDIIVSNPPYISSDVIGTLMPEVREHEPMEALDGGADGLSFYRRILEECRPHLCGGGMLFLEIGYDQAEDVRKLMEDAGFLEINVVKDYGGLDRVVYGTKGFE